MTTLRTWLKQEPLPKRIRMTDGDGETKLVRINDSKSRWRDAERCLQGAAHCEALDADGDTLREWDAEGEQALEQRVDAAVKAGRSELAELARIINEAHDNAAQRHAEAHRQGTDALVALVKVLSERLHGLERAWHGLLMAQAQADEDSPAAGFNEQAIMGLLAAGLQQHQARQAQQQGPPGKRPPRPPPNGAPPPPNGAES